MQNKKKCYPTDLTDQEWQILSHKLPPERNFGRPKKTKEIEIWNAILYVLRSGGSWRMLPNDFPKWQLVYYYFRKWTKNKRIEKLHDILRQEVRKKVNKETEPSLGIIDSQSVKTTEAREKKRI